MKKILICHTDYEAHCIPGLERLRQAGFEIKANPHGRMYTPAELHADIADVDAVIADTELWDEAAFHAAPDLKCLIRFGTGINNLDLDAAERHGVVVANTPGYNANAVAEHTVALLLSLVRSMPQLNEDTRLGKWTRVIFHELAGRTMGILGFGAIGQKTAEKLSGLDANVIAYDKFPNVERARELGVTMCTLYEVLKNSDCLLLHLPLLEATEHIINRETISAMKEGVYIVNTGRGPLVDESAAAEALLSGRLAGLASDVFEDEPPALDNPLFQCPGYICTPHLAGNTFENMLTTGLAAAESVIRVFEGKEPEHRLR